MSTALQADLDNQDMDLLERILRDCHLDDSLEEAAVASRVEPAPAHAPALPLPADVGSWADEMMRQLQVCGSPEEGRARCAEMFAAFHQRSCQPQDQGRGVPTAPSFTACSSSGSCCNPETPCAHSERLQKVQGANRVIVRAIRTLTQRHKELSERARCAESFAISAATELQRCQEALQTSERAKGTLQMHLSLMGSHPIACA